MNRNIVLLLFSLWATSAKAIEYLFVPRITPESPAEVTPPTFQIREADKKIIPERYWTLRGEADYNTLISWMRENLKSEELYIKLMDVHLYSKEDMALWIRLLEQRNKK